MAISAVLCWLRSSYLNLSRRHSIHLLAVSDVPGIARSLVPCRPGNYRIDEAFFRPLGLRLSSFLVSFVRAISRNTTLALFMASVVALDYSCVGAASNGRMDMMCAALGQAALALCLPSPFASEPGAPVGWAVRRRLAVLPSDGCVDESVSRDTRAARCAPVKADSPGARCYSLPDRRGPVRPVRCSSAANILGSGPATSEYRVSNLGALLWNLVNDAYERYFQFYFANFSAATAVRGFALLFGVVGIVALIATKRLRSAPFARILLVFAAAGYLGIALLDNQKFPHYLIYSTPIFSACGALWVLRHLASSRFSAHSRWWTAGRFCGCHYWRLCV